MKPPGDTRSRILDGAEELFGERGLDRVSIRDITRKAKVNLAAINYHFGSKEDLIAEIFWRMKFTYGALQHWLLTKDEFRPDWVEDVDIETQTQKLISFAAAGFRAA